MPHYAPNMTREQKAYLAVGQFLLHFAGMETALNNMLTRLLEMKNLEGLVVTSNIDMRGKIYIVQTALNMRPITEDDWLKEARKDLKSVVTMTEKRNILAHNIFLPHADGVEFHLVRAKGKLDLPEELWTDEIFDGHYAEMDRLTLRLKEITDALMQHRASAVLAALQSGSFLPKGGMFGLAGDLTAA
ncbi:hypothetical protein P6144_00350 [Sphingomonas sp. HITSZ_GF]|uniref:hypothetical protein n=1 Tax=Sphingomonas sp. HITSZ_GF TaxID=3037247 RepID=UPI00240DA34B|nr:hypothetical protein [Sphingomonas sp. HITSZ_GF]MDG2532086.1 hypothetical protein [Sphingomonas sp. HITSZ_GF]